MKGISTAYLATLVVLLLRNGTEAFQSRRIPVSSISQSPMALEDRRVSSALKMGMEDISNFYQNYPMQSAVLTCGLKASVADGIAQARAWKDSAKDDPNVIELKRNAAYIAYGGIFIGLMCNLEYNHLFPILFGSDTSFLTLCKKVFFDDFISAPLMWLPPLYMTKAIMFDYPIVEGLKKYVHDIKEEGLLLKYWSIWVPAQFVTFGVIPEQFRVAFMALISFMWFIVLSSLSAKKDAAAEEGAAQVVSE